MQKGYTIGDGIQSSQSILNGTSVRYNSAIPGALKGITVAQPTPPTVTVNDRAFLFQIFFQPYAENLVETLNETSSVYALFAQSILGLTDDPDKTGNDTVFKKVYNPNMAADPDPIVQSPLPAQCFTFDRTKFGGQDNWFTFYHIIILIVETLLANDRNQEAIQWIENCLYNPKTIVTQPNAANPNAPYWTLPIFKILTQSTETFFNNLSTPNLQTLMNELMADPLDPFIVAYNCPQDFMMYVVTLYVRAHIAQGDDYFGLVYNGGGMDYLNLALEYYKIAEQQLGQQPQTIPDVQKKPPQTYQSLKAAGLNPNTDPDANVQVMCENLFPFCSQVDLQTGGTSPGSLLGGSLAFYFSFPPDTNIQQLYALVNDRLFKVRNSEDINGIFRKIDLFGTPINPAQLLGALAKGLTLSEILDGLYSPAPTYRFPYLLQKSLELAGEVKTLGNAIVSAIERRDNEQLATIRATNETGILNLTIPIKQRQVFETNAQQNALQGSRNSAQSKLYYYEALLGQKDASGNPNTTVPAYSTITTSIDDQTNLPADPIISAIVIPVNTTVVEDTLTGVSILTSENTDLLLMEAAAITHLNSGLLESVSAFMNAIPSFSIKGSPFGVGTGTSFGGSNIGAIFSGQARTLQTMADSLSFGSSLAAKYSSYIRREQDWAFQANNLINDIKQIDRQLAAADARYQIAQLELSNLIQQVANAQQVQDFLANKESNYANYVQIINSLKPVYKNLYDLASYYARSAEQAYQFEKPEKQIDFISYGYDSSIAGLASSGDVLLASLRQMEQAYLQDTTRPLEMRIDIQLSRLDPLALLALRKTGIADISVPEWLILLKNRGVYNAKWISVNFTFPAITGPYITMSGLVSMTSNEIRISMDITPNFDTSGDSDPRFVQNNTPFTQVIISSGVNDTGYNLDTAATANEVYQQQYQPFVHAGFISTWHIDLNRSGSQFDYSELDWDSLRDVIISGVVSVEIGDAPYSSAADTYLSGLFANVTNQALNLFLDIRHDLPNEAYSYISDTTLTAFTFSLDITRFPYIAQNKKITLTGLNIITQDPSLAGGSVGGNTVNFTAAANQPISNYKIMTAAFSNGSSLSAGVSSTPLVINIGLNRTYIKDSFIVLTYKMTPM